MNLVLAISFLPILKVLLVTVFVVVALLMTFVILIQEGKGGGIAGAFGGAAAESFGVKAGSVNRFTAWLATLFIGVAVIYGAVSAMQSEPLLGREPAPRPPAEAPSAVPIPGMDTPPAMDGATPPTTPPAMDGAPPPTPPAPAPDAAMDATPPSPPSPPPAPPEPAPPAMEPGDTPPAPGMQ